tara:strand:+ start:101 stop:520 length:420 start_codon:yes stop_codon:yes gene_type:complete
MTSPEHYYKNFLENMTKNNVDELSIYITKSVKFSDPFHDVTGNDKMIGVFVNMFENFSNVEFKVVDEANNNMITFWKWRLAASFRGSELKIEGTSFLKFDKHGLVLEHIDYWDAASLFYERLPIIGLLLGHIRRRIARL